jgi:hypothetical protein
MKFVTIVLKRHEAAMNVTTPPAAEHPQMPPTLKRKNEFKIQRETNQQLLQVARKLEKVLKKQKMSNGDADNAVDLADEDNAVDLIAVAMLVIRGT